MRILVTGGAGFIGSHYVRTLLDGAYPDHGDTRVTVFDKLTYAGDRGKLPEPHPRLTFVQGDVCDADALLAALPGHDAVVHFAAESHVDRSLASAREFFTTNVLGTQTLLDCCRRTGVDRIVHVSTDEVYGTIDEGSWTEDHPLLPNSPYAASKAASDLAVRAYFRSHDLPVMITRCCNNYGPYQYTEKVIPLFVTNLLSGRDVPLYGDGLNVREWIHVDDHCRAVQLVLENGRPGEVYNIGGGTEITNRELTKQLLELCGEGWDRVRHVTDRKAHDRRYSLDDTKIRRELGYQPAIAFEQGLADIVKWYRDNRDWWDKTTR
ncbi:dTDP-glucose 4,6-dehydratase [Spirillospora sp. NPDC047279]|uniref:dTDP-glucose 4,6-dehydratase n=1 Tax=Spirillospora sp. NPDC047279 TaxID=3155478 RepID=UPI0033D25A32